MWAWDETEGRRPTTHRASSLIHCLSFLFIYLPWTSAPHHPLFEDILQSASLALSSDIVNVAVSVPVWKHCSPHRVQGARTLTSHYLWFIRIPGFLRMCHVRPPKCSLQTPLLSLSMLISGMSTRLEFFISKLKVPLRVLGFSASVYPWRVPCQQSQSDCSPCCPAIPSVDHATQLACAFLVGVCH